MNPLDTWVLQIFLRAAKCGLAVLPLKVFGVFAIAENQQFFLDGKASCFSGIYELLDDVMQE
ncbi:hypothetical protein [Methylosoma difficile]